MWSWSVYLTTLILAHLVLQLVNQYFSTFFHADTNNCPSGITGREMMTVENISWSISMKELLLDPVGMEPRTPWLPMRCASDWAEEAFKNCIGVNFCTFFHADTNNCPSGITGREMMTVENISWSISMKELLLDPVGMEPGTPWLPMRCASDWAEEAFKNCIGVNFCTFFHADTNNCPSGITGREMMTVENISWSISMQELLLDPVGMEPGTPWLPMRCASDWAEEAFKNCIGVKTQLQSTHCSLETPKRVIGKHCRLRSDATECSVWSGSPLQIVQPFVSRHI